ncbi:GNAT family N-acetyltransferase [Muricauda sp. CAU 1633]|uniref:GNAT family N-acetyltransferase n=1 Tax=Allomuricauda sp. CAU 1633 TaxID=2816036 RepID=UPI001A8C5375|nr:GNAT family N-acetyltransferase [Muricauda sp. CAU 1633]MBO0320916.1 GNAT family N-acetyltransferase [Muricauda sp. CAU 1633]
MGLNFRECTISDLDTLVNISKSTFVAAFEKDNDPDDFQDYIQKAFSSDRLEKELKNTDSLFYFVFDDKTLAGYFKLNMGSAQTDVHDQDSIELERIYVIQEHQGKKIGAQMLKEILALGKKLSKAYLWLGVWEHNPKAIRFYQRHGFQKFGEHPYYIGKDKQTDWLLRLDL